MIDFNEHVLAFRREKQRVYKSRWDAKNKEKIAVHRKSWQDKNPGKEKAMAADRYKKHKKKMNEKAREYQAKRRAADNAYKETQNHKARNFYCKRKWGSMFLKQGCTVAQFETIKGL